MKPLFMSIFLCHLQLNGHIWGKPEVKGIDSFMLGLQHITVCLYTYMYVYILVSHNSYLLFYFCTAVPFFGAVLHLLHKTYKRFE